MIRRLLSLSTKRESGEDIWTAGSCRGPIVAAEMKEALRVQFGSSVAVALESLSGADELATAVAPSWDVIGGLAAIAV